MRRKPFVIFMAVCAILNACGHHDHSHNHEEEGESHFHVDGIKISPERQAVLGIITDTVEVGEFNEIIRTSGQIISSTGDEMTVVAKSEGIVNLSGLTEGSPVGKAAGSPPSHQGKSVPETSSRKPGSPMKRQRRNMNATSSLARTTL